MESLEKYRQLLERVDRFSAAVTARFPEHVTCHRGCDACCTHIGVLPVEGFALAMAVAARPEAEAAEVRARAWRMRLGGGCPLLEENSCLLYEARPVICRTQGLPLLLEENGRQRVDYCPLNFQGLESLPGDLILNLEILNQSLAAINLLFLEELGGAAADFPERFSIAEALLLELKGLPGNFRP